jgi:hypothetical protein
LAVEMTDDLALEATIMRAACHSDSEAASRLGIARSTFQNRMRRAAERGLVAPGVETMPGFVIKSLAHKTADGTFIRQGKAPGEVFQMPETHTLGKLTVQRDADGRVVQDWIRALPDAAAQQAAMKAASAAFAESLPHAVPVQPPAYTVDSLLNLYVVTDVHLGSLAWSEETGNADYDLRIGEQLLDDWFAAAIELAPPAETAILAQLGDLLHWDGFESVTPTNRHVLDGDSRFDKMVRVAISAIRKIVKRLLAKHKYVHIVMADANHDPASESWMRGWMAAHYEDEPRVTVDDSAGTYYAYKHGDVSLFMHHGHKRRIGDVDSVFAGRYREIYGNTKYSYAHIGHLHSDELKSTNLMKVERHETLAAPDAYAANGGWLSGRSAKVITYSKDHGEVARLTLTPGMVAGAAKRVAANDNNPEARRAA